MVKEEFIGANPETVRRLVDVTQRATDWINHYPDEAATVMLRQLSFTLGETLPLKAAQISREIEMTPKVFFRSMARIEYTTDINPNMVQEIIDYMAGLGYIKGRFEANDILDLSFLR